MLWEPEVSLEDRLVNLGRLMSMISPVPEEWITDVKSSTYAEGPALPTCTEWKAVVQAWRKAMKWTDGLEHGLACMLASIASTMQLGDQLWLKIISPAGSGKSSLCEALSMNKDYTIAKSTIRGFHSGYKTDKEGEEDYSLVKLTNGKTLITKDGDTLLQAANIGKILSEARDLYDGTARTHYLHGVSHDYDNHRMTWLLCGTNALRALDQSELGERFLDVVIMDGIDDEMEDEVLWRVVNRADRLMSYQANGSTETNQDPDMFQAMSLTGGYIGYLRENASAILSSFELTREQKMFIGRLAKFTSYMRARPSTRQFEVAEREFAARLASQFCRLAKCLTIVMNYPQCNDKVMEKVKQVALDTSRGKVMEIVDYIWRRPEGVLPKGVAQATSTQLAKMYDMMIFMRDIGILEIVEVQKSKAVSAVQKWCLTSLVKKLWEEIHA